MENLQTQPQEMVARETKAVFATDLMLTLVMGSITKNFTDYLLGSKQLPSSLRGEIEKVRSVLIAMRSKVLSTTPGKENSAPWLRRELQKDKLNDIANLIETVSRIGTEERDEVYEEFLSIVVDCLQTIFYAQENRKNIHFGKYRALFKLFTDELRADVNKTPGQVLFQNNKLYLRTQAEDAPQQIKK